MTPREIVTWRFMNPGTARAGRSACDAECTHPDECAAVSFVRTVLHPEPPKVPVEELVIVEMQSTPTEDERTSAFRLRMWPMHGGYAIECTRVTADVLEAELRKSREARRNAN